MAAPEETGRVIAISESGTADDEELNNAIADAWRTVLSDERERVKIAAILEARVSELDPSNPPFKAHVRGAGTFGADVLIALAVGFAIGVAKGFGEGEGEPAGKAAAKALNRLWVEYIRDRVNPLGSGKLGPEKDDSEQN
jgi:hypothetical protein